METNRKEVVEWVRGIYQNLDDADKRDALRFFPELRESEEERMGDIILEGFKNYSRSFSEWNDVPVERIIAYLERQKEQKPAESTEQQQVNQPEDISVSYDYKIGFSKGVEAVLKYPQDYGLCKPAEWSERDEAILNSLVRLYSKEYIGEKWPWSNGEFTYGDVIVFLKSLRPQPHWKPSEEQIEALHKAIKKAYHDYDARPLESLRNDLLKLKQQ